MFRKGQENEVEGVRWVLVRRRSQVLSCWWLRGEAERQMGPATAPFSPNALEATEISNSRACEQ